MVLVFRLSGQGLAVGGVVAAEVLPLLILGPFAGVIVDRFNRKHVLIASDLCRAGLALSLAWPRGVWHAYVVAAGMAAAGSFFNPAFQAAIAMVTTERQRLAANSVAWSTGRLVQIIAAAAAGGLIAVNGTGPAFLANAASFAIAALCAARLQLTSRSGEAASNVLEARMVDYVTNIREAFQYVAASLFLRRLLLVQALASLATGGTGAMLVVLAERHLALSAAGFAWLIGAIGVGALLGPLIPNALQADFRSGQWLYVPYMIRGAGDILLAMITPIPVALVLLFIYGLNTSTGLVVFNSMLQTHVPDRLRGRVFTLFDMTWGACRLVSLVLGGAIVDSVGVRQVYWAGGALLTLAGAIGLTEGLGRAREAGGQR